MFRRAVTIDPGRVASPALKDFPVLVHFTDPSLKSVEHGGHVSGPDGADIFFTSADGATPFPHEVANYVPAEGELKAWVRIPELSDEADTVFHLCYGGDVPAGSKPAADVCGDACKTVVYGSGQANTAARHPAPDLDLRETLTVEAWVESPAFQAEAMQAVVSQWRISESFDRFDAYDASNTSGMVTRGFFGAVFDGRYVYFVPQHDGVARHGKVLRYDTHGSFKDAASWSAYDAGNTADLSTKGYYGAVFTGRYVIFIPRVDKGIHHTRILRYDTQADFTAPESWHAYDIGHAVSHQSAAFDGRYIYGCPGYESPSGGRSGKVLRYDTHGSLDDPDSYAVHDAADTGGLDTVCYDGAVFDGRYVYFAHLERRGMMLRYDTHAGFTDDRSWQSFDALEVSGLPMGPCVGAIFDGRYVYYVCYANSVVVRFDTTGEFQNEAAWSAYDAADTSGLLAKGYDGAVFDGRYVYFIPFWEGATSGEGFHGKVLRHDAAADFTDAASWQAVDAGKTDGLASVGFNGGAFDGRFIYFTPWRDATEGDQEFNASGNVLRYDTTGPNASFSLRCVDLGHNGGLCAALPGPSFLVNTEDHVLAVHANRNLSPGRHHLVGVYDGRSIRLFIDGLLAAERAGSGTIQRCDADVVIGELERGLARFKGAIADVRISDLARSPEWIATRYRNQSAAAAFCTIGDEESV